jgi:hypothetical protein
VLARLPGGDDVPDILGLLEVLADLHAQQRAIRQAQAVALPARVRSQLAAVEARFAPELAAVASEVALVEQQVKAAVIAHGQSVKGSRLHAIFLAGRVLWNTDKLEGFAAVYPEVLSLRSVGKPSVTIRKVT